MMRPSLNELAHQHASRRWPKKKRNADLRRHGYDPDGADGEIYRDAFARACQTDRMARFAAEESRGADALSWCPPRWLKCCARSANSEWRTIRRAEALRWG